MIDLSLLSTGTAQPSTQEDEESEEEPNVAQDRQEKLSSRQTQSVDVIVLVVIEKDHDEERGVDRKHPNIDPLDTVGGHTSKYPWYPCWVEI